MISPNFEYICRTCNVFYFPRYGHSAQVAQVMEFASNLRQGIVELPLNDRSADLLAQLSNIKAEREVDKITITRLEKEIFALSETRKDKDPIGDGEKAILKHALKELQVENKALKSYICRACIVLVIYYVKTLILILVHTPAHVQYSKVIISLLIREPGGSLCFKPTYHAHKITILAV